MKYLIILVLLVVGCAPIHYYPPGVMGNQVQYYSSGLESVECDMCGEICYIFKQDSRGRIICPDCFEVDIAKIRKAR